MQQPDFMSIDLAQFYDVRRSFDLALEEYLIHLLHQPKKEKYIQDKILLMSDEEIAQPLIVFTLNKHYPENKKPILRILAGYYFKLGNFDLAANQHKKLGFESKNDVSRFLSFAKHLRSEKQYSYAMDIYSSVLSKSRGSEGLVTSKQLGEALLGMGQTYEDQIVIQSRLPKFATYFKDNIFFEDQFFGQPDISNASLSSTFDLYHDILKHSSGSLISPQVHIRLAEIQYRFTRDFDGARRSLKLALSGNIKPHLKRAVYARLCDLLLAEGNPEQCIMFIENDIPNAIKTSSENSLAMKTIQSFFLSGNATEAQIHLDSILVKIKPSHPYFNDLLELGDLLSLRLEGNSISDSTAFSLYLQAEGLIRQSKLSEAVELLALVQSDFPEAPITSNAVFREAIVRFSLGEPSRTLELSDKLSGTSFASHGLAIQGEVFEQLLQDPKTALIHYHALLETYPSSLLAEPIRRHARQLNERTES
jgi:predicted negative regulator of RcsB-dependent stress response